MSHTRLGEACCFALLVSSLNLVVLALWALFYVELYGGNWEGFFLLAYTGFTGVWFGANVVYFAWARSEQSRQRSLRRWAGRIQQTPPRQHQELN